MNLQRLPVANDRQTAGSHGAASPGKSTGLKVHNLVWSASGPDGSLRQALAGAIDGARLQSLVGRPLPAVSESEAFAARAVPVSVADLPAAAAGAAPVSGAQPATPAAPQSVATSPAAAPGPVAASQQPAAVPTVDSAPDTGRKALDTVNQLRGLFGR